MSALLRPYGASTTLVFPIRKRGAVDFAVSADWTPATGDTKISKDEGADANTNSNPAAVGSAAGKWSLALTSTEMQAARICITIIDSATKAVEDQCLLIETYGHASAQHPALPADVAKFGGTAGTFSSGRPDVNAQYVGGADASAPAELTSVPAINTTLVKMIQWLFTLARNKITQTSSAQTVKKDDGSTTLATSSISDDGTTFVRDEFS